MIYAYIGVALVLIAVVAAWYLRRHRPVVVDVEPIQLPSNDTAPTLISVSPPTSSGLRINTPNIVVSGPKPNMAVKHNRDGSVKKSVDKSSRVAYHKEWRAKKRAQVALLLANVESQSEAIQDLHTNVEADVLERDALRSNVVALQTNVIEQKRNVEVLDKIIDEAQLSPDHVRFTKADVSFIRSYPRKRGYQNELAERFDTSPTNISCIVNNKRWKTVD